MNGLCGRWNMNKFNFNEYVWNIHKTYYWFNSIPNKLTAYDKLIDLDVYLDEYIYRDTISCQHLYAPRFLADDDTYLWNIFDYFPDICPSEKTIVHYIAADNINVIDMMTHIYGNHFMGLFIQKLPICYGCITNVSYTNIYNFDSLNDELHKNHISTNLQQQCESIYMLYAL